MQDLGVFVNVSGKIEWESANGNSSNVDRSYGYLLYVDDSTW